MVPNSFYSQLAFIKAFEQLIEGVAFVMFLMLVYVPSEIKGVEASILQIICLSMEDPVLTGLHFQNSYF